MANGLILNDLIVALKTNISAFEKAIQVSPTRIDKIINRNSKINLDVVQKIIDKYPSVNKGWLLTGNGEMFTKEPIDNTAPVSNKQLTHNTEEEDLDLRVAIKQLAEATNRHSIIDERNSRNIERLIALLELKFGVGPTPVDLPEPGGERVVDIREKSKESQAKK